MIYYEKWVARIIFYPSMRIFSSVPHIFAVFKTILLCVVSELKMTWKLVISAIEEIALLREPGCVEQILSKLAQCAMRFRLQHADLRHFLSVRNCFHLVKLKYYSLNPLQTANFSFAIN